MQPEETPGEALRLPHAGERILVPSFLHLEQGVDNFYGGLCTISRVIRNSSLPADHMNYCMIEIEEGPGTQYNWKSLLESQEEWMARYGHQKGGVQADDQDEE